MKPITTLLAAGLLLIACSAFGQALTTNFTPANIPSTPIGTGVSIQLRVTNFTKISSLQLPITYNSAVLRFDSIDFPIMPGYGDTTTASHPTAGKVVVAWFPNPSQYPQGVTYAANTALFTLRFTVKGTGTATVNVGTAAPGIEVINSTGNTVSVSYQSGGSTVIGGGGGGGGNNTGGCTGTGNPPTATTYTGFKVIANQIYIPQGQYGCMPVTVNGFSNILTLLFAMHWDPTVLQYDCTRAHNLPDLASKINLTAPNTLVVAWDDPAAAGVTRADGAKIFDVCFRAIGAPGAQTIITMNGTGLPSGSGTSPESYNASSTNVWVPATEVKDTVFVVDPANPGCAVTFTADKDSVASGTQTCVDVKASKFFWMTNTEFTITYDPTKLTYQSIDLGTNPLSLNTSGAMSNFTTASGSIKFNWANTTAATGVTIPDNTTIFSVCYNVTEPPGSSTNINFGSVPCSGIGASRKNIGGVPLIAVPGYVKTGSITTSVTASVTNPNCSTGTASLTATATGATVAGYAWAGPGFTSNLQSPTGITTSGTYSVTVTFSNGPSTSTNVQVTIPPAITIPAAQATVVAVSCFGGNNGSISINPAGGTAPYTYKWAGPNNFMAQTKDIANLLAGNYVVTVTDSKGCSLSSNAFPVNGPQVLTLLTGSIQATNVKCSGGGDGSINISNAITGGTAGYSVAWTGPNGYTATGTAITGLLTGNYTPTVTDSRGCTNIGQPITIGAPQPIAVNVGAIDDVKCSGSSDGCITLNVSGGTPGYTFAWTKVGGGAAPQSVQSPCGLAAGSYLVTVTDNNSCTKAVVNNITVAAPPSAVSMNPTTTPASCAGVNDGSITLNQGGGWPGQQTVSYSGGPVPLPGISPVSGVPAGTYTATYSDAKGCSVTQQVTVGGAPSMSFPTPNVTNVLCYGDANGCISITPAGGSGAPYTITWTNTTLAGATICGLNPGTYTPTIKDNAGCTQLFNAITVSGPSAPITLTGSTTQSPNGTIDLSVSGGTGTNYTYKWNGPGVSNVTTQDLSGLAAGTYTVEVRDANNCVKTGSYTIQPSNLLIGSGIVSVTNVCDHDGAIFIKVPDQALPPFTVQWSGGLGVNVEFEHSFSVNNLTAGNYNVTITGANSQSVVLDTILVELHGAVVGSSAMPPNGSSMNGSISLTPAYPNDQYAYMWSANAGNATTKNVSSLDSGTYTVKITNLTSGCTATQTFHLDRVYPTQTVALNKTNPTCGTFKNGEIHLTVSGGVPVQTYAWSGPNGLMPDEKTKDLINIGAGTYTCTITQGNGDTSTQTATLTAQSTLAITNVSELSTCNGGFQVCDPNYCNGKASVSFSGQAGVASILWSNGVTTVLNETLCSGAYSVTVTDGVGCTSVWSDALTAPPVLGATNEILGMPSCHSDCDGSAQVKTIGGVPPYTVKWSTGQNDQISVNGGISKAVGVCGGSYTVTVTDYNNISTTTQFTVADPDPITLNNTIIIPNSFSSCDGQVVVDLNGATLPANIVWSGSFGHSGTGQRAENLCAGELVSFIITDAHGCSAVGSDSIPYPPDGCLQVRPVMTPGLQDGNNDYLLISCIEAVENSIEIYNRWGQLVFETKKYDNLSNNWKGLTVTGQPVAEGVYFYILNYVNEKGVSLQKKGYINLLR
ncbi:MAG: gliding motility-associated C-terminal domain-containing protein [Bacteroidota bacterium]